MKDPGGVQIQAVVAGTCPIAVAIDQRDIKRQKPQQAIDIEDRFDRIRQISAAGFVQDLAQINQSTPGHLLVFRLDLEPLLIAVQFLTKVSHSAIGIRTPGYFPASSRSAPEVFLDEVFIELLDITENPPTLIVDHDLDKIRLGNGKKILANERIERATHHRRITVAVEQVQCLVSVEPLIGVNEVHGEVKRAF